MSDIKDGGPAFPFLEFHGAGPEYQQHKGLSVRDYFAAKALSGLLASRSSSSTYFLAKDDAAYVYAIADAMLKAREAK